ncbi:MAG: pirin family protein [Crocinitomicaceae bacterium]|nr:pirin family protein [Crocinitomicaceae bacterium]
MKEHKIIDKIVSAKSVKMGSDLLKQLLPYEAIDQIDPFLLIQHGAGQLKGNTHPKNVGVGPHPHRGFSPVTFVFKGSVHHRDSAYNSGVVDAGGTQWMHAGSGIIHSERPGKEFAESGGENEFIQFWVNSPAKNKMDAPSYQAIWKEETPVVTKDAAEIAVVAGDFEGTVGPANTLTPQTLLRINAEKGVDFSFEIPQEFNCLIYLLDGELEINDQQVRAEQMIYFERKGEVIRIKAAENARAMLLSGEPIGESVSSYGPFVMNTQTEIMEALRDSQAGKMGVLIEQF